MIKFMRLSVLAAIAIVFLFGGMAAAAGKNGGPSKGTLSDQEIEDLRFVRDEEKLARDVYLFFFEAYNKPVFSNIASAEQQHMDAVKTLLDRYGIADPVAGLGPGEFALEVHRELYAALTGFPESKALFADPLQGALYVGATIEDLDILDIQVRLGHTTRYDLTNVYENLMKGSRNHLRSYGGLLESLYGYDYANGDRYFGEFLPAAEITAIINSPRETGSL